MLFEFPFILIDHDKLTMTFNGPIMERTQILVHRWGPEQGFQRYSAEGLNQCIVSSLAQAKSHEMKQLESVSSNVFERRTTTEVDFLHSSAAALNIYLGKLSL